MTDQDTKTKRTAIIEGFGWYGVLALLAAYALLTFGIIGSNNIWYQALNVTGAIAIVADALNQRNYQPAVLNIIWAVVGLIALIRIII
jgi:hypothetical protein